MKPYTFPICKMLGYTDSQSPSPAANGEPVSPEVTPPLGSLNCLKCKRTLIPGALYADTFTDTALFCHKCNADHWWASYYAAEETIYGNEENEGRFGQ